jgi:hypothetical protein
MPFTIPRITRPLLLTDYAPEFVKEDGKPAVIHVWVNPPREFIQKHESLRVQRKRLRAELEKAEGEQILPLARELAVADDEWVKWYAELWSQHAEAETHWTPEAVWQVFNAEGDPQLYDFLITESIGLINAHRTGTQKK